MAEPLLNRNIPAEAWPRITACFDKWAVVEPGDALYEEFMQELGAILSRFDLTVGDLLLLMMRAG